MRGTVPLARLHALISHLSLSSLSPCSILSVVRCGHSNLHHNLETQPQPQPQPPHDLGPSGPSGGSPSGSTRKGSLPVGRSLAALGALAPPRPLTPSPRLAVVCRVSVDPRADSPPRARSTQTDRGTTRHTRSERPSSQRAQTLLVPAAVRLRVPCAGGRIVGVPRRTAREMAVPRLGSDKGPLTLGTLVELGHSNHHSRSRGFDDGPAVAIPRTFASSTSRRSVACTPASSRAATSDVVKTSADESLNSVTRSSSLIDGPTVIGEPHRRCRKIRACPVCMTDRAGGPPPHQDSG
jgi:hypothetical protein